MSLLPGWRCNNSSVMKTLQLFSFSYLRRAFDIISDTESVYNCEIMIREIVESTDLKKVVSQK
jgi:hypothetical protein